jgi:hypothetical protein
MERPCEGGGKQIHTAFIPTSFAKVGKHVEILIDSAEDDEGKWSRGWVVTERGSTMDSKALDLQRSAERSFATKLDSKKRR